MGGGIAPTHTPTWGKMANAIADRNTPEYRALDAQRARARRAAKRAEWNMACRTCGSPLQYSGVGQPPKYCDAKCKENARPPGYLLAWQRANRDKARGYTKKWHQKKVAEDPEYVARKNAASRRPTLESIDPYGAATYMAVWARFEYYGWKCWICKTELTPETVTRDHVKPVSAGGLHVPANIRPACQPCNSSKNNRWPLSPDELKVSA